MTINTKNALLALSLIGSVAIYPSGDNDKVFGRNIVTGRGNVIIKHYGSGTIHEYYDNDNRPGFMCGEFIEKRADGFKVTNIDCKAPASDIKTNKIQLTGTKKRVPLKDAIDKVSLPPYLAEVTISDRDSYIECDEAVFGSDLEIKVRNGKLGHKVKKNTSTKFKGTGGKPLCTVFAKMLNDALLIDGSSNVHVNTPSAKHITTSSFSRVSTGESAAGVESIDASGSAKVTMPYASALKKIVAASFSDVSTGESATSVTSIDVSGSAKVRVPNAPMLKKIKADSFSDVSIGDGVTSVESINVSGSAKVSIPNLNTKTFNAVLDSFSRVNVRGNCDQQSVTASGSSEYNASDLKSNFATVNASSFSSVKLWVNRVLGGWADGSASVRYRGNAVDNVKTSSFASCKKIRS